MKHASSVSVSVFGDTYVQEVVDVHTQSTINACDHFKVM